MAALRELAGGRADLRAEVCGVMEGASEGELHEPLAPQAAGTVPYGRAPASRWISGCGLVMSGRRCWLARSAGACCQVVYLPVDVPGRSSGAGHMGISPFRGKTALRVAMIARSTGSPGS